MRPLDALLARHRPRGARLLSRAVAALVVLLVGWAFLAELDEVAVAQGQVVPQGDVKVVQHLEGGIVEELLVREGDMVRAGEPLIRLALGTGAMNPGELQVQLDGFLLRRARLEAEVDGTAAAFPTEAGERRPEVLLAERRAFQTREAALKSALAVFDQQVRQSRAEAREYAAARAARREELAYSRKSLATLEDLAKDGLASRLELNEKQGEVARLAGEIASLEAAIGRAGAAEREALERKAEAVVSFRREAQAELAEVEVLVATARERLESADDQARRTTVRSPIDGIVGELRVSTIGGVVGPGQPIMEVVPAGGPLIVEARLKPSDRGFVAPGQKATVKISAYDFVRYGGLDGEVRRIAPDSRLDAEGRPYFKVVVETDRAWLGETPEAYPIGPGMQATVDIHTGRRTVADFLLRPVLKLRHEAFRER